MKAGRTAASYRLPKEKPYVAPPYVHQEYPKHVKCADGAVRTVFSKEQEESFLIDLTKPEPEIEPEPEPPSPTLDTQSKPGKWFGWK